MKPCRQTRSAWGSGRCKGFGGAVSLLSADQMSADAFDLAARLGRGRRPPVRACFGTCAPGVADVLDGLDGPVAILPLFLAEGLLLSHVRALAAQHGWRIASPLGERAAELVRQRYERACAQLAS